MRSTLLPVAVLLAFVCPAWAADADMWATAEFTPRDINPPDDGIADVFVGGDPNTYKYLFIKAGTEDRACAEFDISGIPAGCGSSTAELRFFIRTLDDGVEPADPIEVKWYEGNGLPDLADFDPADGQFLMLFDGPIEDPFDPNQCPSVYGEQVLDVTPAFQNAMAQGWDYVGFVFRDTFEGGHRFDIYSNTWNCQPPSNCCEESYIRLFITYALPGDFDHDGDVDLEDLATLLGSYGVDDGGDTDGDGDTDLQDLAELLGNYGATCP